MSNHAVNNQNNLQRTKTAVRFLSSSEPPHSSLLSILGNHLRYGTEIDFQVIRQERGGQRR